LSDSSTIYLVDDDVVEGKNLLRQNFISVDIGQYKARVLAQRYRKAYGNNVIPILNR
jgi:molybdopterin/thiamine biosynthesis adenylyltransferase